MSDDRLGFYNRLGAGYMVDADPYVAAYHEHRIKTAVGLLSQIKPGALYDFGCGSGELIARLPTWRPIMGCDLSPAMVEIARARTGLAIERGGIRRWSHSTCCPT